MIIVSLHVLKEMAFLSVSTTKQFLPHVSTAMRLLISKQVLLKENVFALTISLLSMANVPIVKLICVWSVPKMMLALAPHVWRMLNLLMKALLMKLVNALIHIMSLIHFVCPALPAVLTVTQLLTALSVCKTMALESQRTKAVSVYQGITI